MVKPSTATNANTTCRARLKRGILKSSLSGESPDSLPSTEVEDEIQHHCDSSASLCWEILPHRSAEPCQHIWETHTSPRSAGAELWCCWQTLACSFHAFQRSVIVFDVPEKHRMILTLCYPLFYNRTWLENSHFSEEQKLETAPEHLLYEAETLPGWFTHSSVKRRGFSPHNCKAKISVSNERWDSKYGTLAMHTSGRPYLAHIVGTPDLKHTRENNPRSSMCFL